MKKRVISFVLALMMVLSLVPISAFAIEASSLTLKDATVTVDGTQNQTVNVVFTANSDMNIAILEGTFSEESDYLTLDSFVSPYAIAGTNNVDVPTGKVMYADPTFVGYPVSADGNVMTAVYTVDKDTPTGTYDVQFTLISYMNDLGEDLANQTYTATINVTNNTPAPCEHTYENGACTKCGAACTHTWAEGVCGTCGVECAHAEYENGACKVCGKVEEATAASAPLAVTVNSAAMEVKFIENGNNQNWYFVSVNGSNLEISGTTENPLKKANNVSSTDGKVTVALSSLKANEISKLPEAVVAYANSSTTQLYVCSFEFTSGTNLPSGQARGNLFIEMSCDHSWLDASCTTGEVCEHCGVVKTGSIPAGHKLLGNGTCENCEATVPAISATANGKPVEVAYTTASSGYAYEGVVYLEIYEDSDLQIVKTDAYTNNYTWSQIEAAYQTTTRADGSPAWLNWPASYKLPLKSDVADLVNMPYFQIRTNSSGTTYDFIVIGVKSHPDHSYVNGECSICGKVCDHSWTDGVCGTCGTECAHAEYENGACKVCGKAEPVVDLSLFNITVNGEAAPVYAGMNSKNKLRHGTTITGTSITLSTKNGAPITLVADGTANRITGEKYSVTNSSSSITLDLGSFSSTDLSSASYDTALNFPYGTDTTIYRLMVTVEGESSKQQIYVEVECDHEYWQEASCSNPKVCLGCGKFGSYPAHKLMGDGTCENCETTVPAIGVTSNGKPVDLFYSTASNNSAYTGVLYMEIYEGSDLQIVKKDAYTDNYTWSQIQRAYQTTEDQYGNPAWPQWVDSYKLPINTPVADMVNMPFFQRRTSYTAYDFYVIGVIAHPDHTFVDGECTICGACEHLNWTEATCETPKTCDKCGKTDGEALGHSWNAETGACGTCGTTCAHEEYENGACKVCGLVCVHSEYNAEGVCTACGAVKPNPIIGIEISHPNLKTETNPETGAVTMTMTMVSGVSEQLDLSVSLEQADLPATQEVFWSVSDEKDAAGAAAAAGSVATVDQNGKLTAKGAGTAVVTAMAADPTGIALLDTDQVLAQFTLTVSDPEAGYTATVVGDDKTVSAGEPITVPITVGHTANEDENTENDVKTYKSYEFIFQYDPELLTLETNSSESEGKDFSVADENGTVTVRRYGEALNVGGTAVSLEFSANQVAETTVKLISAKVGTSEDSQDQDIPAATILDDLIRITVDGYQVDLDEAFTADSLVAGSTTPYSFEAKDKNYVYTVDVTVDGTEEPFQIADTDEDGILSIPADEITGNLKIRVNEAKTVGKTFPVSIKGSGVDDVTGAPEAQYMSNYVLTAADGVDLTGYTIKYKIGDGEEKTMSNNTIPGGEITGNITITVTAPGTDPDDPSRPANTWKITFAGNGAADVTGAENPAYIAKGNPFSFSITKADGYIYIVTYTMGENVNAPLTADETTGAYSITPTGDVTITVMKWNVEVDQYVSLDGKIVFLISVLEADNLGMKYDNNTMYVKSINSRDAEGKATGEAAAKYVYLEEVASGTLTPEDAAKKLTIVENVTCETVALDYNVNESTNLDINDAQLVYDMYNSVYESIETVGVKKFLRADLNGDRTINVSDAAAVVSEILK